jgi:hypothetical protein
MLLMTGTSNIQKYFKDIIFKAVSNFACDSAAQTFGICILVWQYLFYLELVIIDTW